MAKIEYGNDGELIIDGAEWKVGVKDRNTLPFELCI